MKRILVTGSREWSDPEPVRRLLAHLHRKFGPCHLVHGAARGLDLMAASIAEQLGWSVEPHPADWMTFRSRAGGIRNQEMVELGADLCLAFPLPSSIGTWDCIRRAKVAHIPTVVFGQKNDDDTSNT